MRVLVIGASGLIGSHVAAHLARRGVAVRAAARRIDEPARRAPGLEWRRADLARFTAEDWRPLLAGVDTVVNCAGALQATRDDDLERVHASGLAVLTEACRAAGVTRFVHISAVGVGEGRPTAFNATKLAGERALARSELDWVIFRPGFAFSPSAFGGSALLRALAACPFIIPAVHASAPVQVVGVEDIAVAVERAIDTSAPSRFSADLVASGQTTLAELLTALRGWLGFRPARVVDLPEWLARPATVASDLLAQLGWRSPLRSTTLAQLKAGVVGDPSSAHEWLGIRPLSLRELLQAHPAGVQERWFAHLYLLKPAILTALAAFWATSGAVGLLSGELATAVLAQADWPPTAARAAVVAGSLLDLALALLVSHRRTAGIALNGMLLVSAAYLAGATLLRPDLWFDPLGPLVKVIPATVLALVGIAVLSDR